MYVRAQQATRAYPSHIATAPFIPPMHQPHAQPAAAGTCPQHVPPGTGTHHPAPLLGPCCRCGPGAAQPYELERGPFERELEGVGLSHALAGDHPSTVCLGEHFPYVTTDHHTESESSRRLTSWHLLQHAPAATATTHGTVHPVPWRRRG